MAAVYAIVEHPDGSLFVRINDQWLPVDKIG